VAALRPHLAFGVRSRGDGMPGRGPVTTTLLA
jgi:hypothetical protein